MTDPLARAKMLLAAATVARRDADEIAYRWPPPRDEVLEHARYLGKLADDIDREVGRGLTEAQYEAACVASHEYIYGTPAERVVAEWRW